jgi:hypothetical protein
MAATIYEPLSTAHLKSCTVDFDSRPDKKAVNLVQYDQTIPVLCVSLKKGGTEYKVPSDADVNIRMDKRDGYHVYNPALGVNAERTIAYFAVTPQMSTGWGDYYPIVEITVGGGIAGSAPIWLQFDRNPLPENAIISSDEYKTIQQLLEDVTAVKAATEQIKAQTEAVRDQAKGFADNAKNSADKAQTLVDGMPSDYSQAMKDIGTLKNQMQHAYPDDSTIGENPWSSKNIVDMLCPPLEESGNPVVCYPVAGYPLGVKAKWEPMQEGTGTPSPENIRPIKGRDSVNVERCGENLLPFGERIENIYKQQLMTSDDLLLLSKACAGQELTLTFSVETKNIVFGDTVEDEWRKRIGFECHGTLADGTEVYVLQCWIDDTNGELTQNGKKTKTLTVTMPKLASGDIVFYAQNIKSGSFVAYDFGIYAGTTAPTTYTPYNGQTNTLTLPETVYGGEVDAVSGDGNENTKIITLDGTTNMFRLSGEFWNLPQNSSPGIRNGYDTNCSHFPPETFGGNKNKGYLFTKPQLLGKYFQDVNAFNAYLAAQYAAGTPVQVSYKLAEPVPFTATGAKPLPALVGMNTVLTDADSATVTGRADPIKRITDLEAAVASIN